MLSCDSGNQGIEPVAPLCCRCAMGAAVPLSIFKNPGAHCLPANLARRSARQIRLRPDRPAPDALKVGEARIGPLDRGGGIVLIAAQGEDCIRLRSLRRLELDHRATLNAGLLFDRRFEVLGVDVYPGGRDDYFALAPEKAEFAG